MHVPVQLMAPLIPALVGVSTGLQRQCCNFSTVVHARVQPVLLSQVIQNQLLDERIKCSVLSYQAGRCAWVVDGRAKRLRGSRSQLLVQRAMSDELAQAVSVASSSVCNKFPDGWLPYSEHGDQMRLDAAVDASTLRACEDNKTEELVSFLRNGRAHFRDQKVQDPQAGSQLFTHCGGVPESGPLLNEPG